VPEAVPVFEVDRMKYKNCFYQRIYFHFGAIKTAGFYQPSQEVEKKIFPDTIIKNIGEGGGTFTKNFLQKFFFPKNFLTSFIPFFMCGTKKTLREELRQV